MKWKLALIFFLLPVFAYAGKNTWTTDGPFGGSVKTFTFHPSKSAQVFAGAHGGLFRSTDTGSSWQRLELESFNPAVVRIHPRKPDTILVGGDGVYQSTDNGGTFELLFRRFPEPVVDMEFHPTDPQIVYLFSGHSGGVYKTTDAGKTWVAVNRGIKLEPHQCCGYSQIEVSPVNGNIVYVLQNTGRIYKSTNGGMSWSSIQNGLPRKQPDYLRALAVDPENGNVVYVGGGLGIFKTTDGGASWQSVCEGCFVRPGAITLDRKNPRNVYSSHQRSTDGGITWTQMDFPHPCIDFGAIAVHPKSPKIVMAGADSTGGIFRSMNSGETWEPVSLGVDAESIWHLQAAVSKPGFLLANTGGQIRISRDFGKNWQAIKDCIAAVETQIHPANANLIMATGWSGGGKSFAVSRDAGKSWETTTPFPAATAMQVDPVDEKVVYIAPLSSSDPNEHPSLGVAKSTDQGESWRLVNSGLTDKEVTVIRISPHDRNVLLAGTESGKIFSSLNGGSRWKNNSRGLGTEAVRAIAFDPENARIIYAATNEDNVSSLFKSTDSGRTWVRKTNGVPSDFGVRFIAVDPSNSRILFAGGPTSDNCICGVGAFLISTDGAETWTAFDSRGLGQFGVLDFLINPWKPESFLIGTERGMFSYTRTISPNGPVIEQLSPPTGKVGDSVAIVGRNFGQIQGSSLVSFSGISAGTADSWTDTRIQVRAPTGVRTGPVSVTVSGRKSNSFEFIALPASGNLEPTSGPSSGGTRVTILAPSTVSGTQFNVLFGSILARDIRFTAPNIITCTTPPGSGTVTVSVTTSAVTTNVGNFTYQ